MVQERICKAHASNWVGGLAKKRKAGMWQDTNFAQNLLADITPDFHVKQQYRTPEERLNAKGMMRYAYIYLQLHSFER